MFRTLVLGCCFLLLTTSLSGANYLRNNPEPERVEDAEYLRSLSRRGIFDCKRLDESCSGAPPGCCGTLQCYWANGFSVYQSGVCVSCVDRSLKCQRNDQCCSPLVCQKNDLYSVDGTCEPKRPTGGNCYRDSQCESNDCEITWLQKLKREVGRCA